MNNKLNKYIIMISDERNEPIRNQQEDLTYTAESIRINIIERGAKFMDVAACVGITPPSLSTALKRSTLTMYQLSLIAQYLGMTIEQLVTTPHKKTFCPHCGKRAIVTPFID